MKHLEIFKKKAIVIMNNIFENKKLFFSILAIIIFLFIYAFFVKGYIKEQEMEEMVEQEQIEIKKNVEKKAEKLKDAKFSRITFFLTSPIRASLAVPDYIEGNYRVREEGNKMTFFYIKESEFVSPIFYIKYAERDRIVPEEGEKKILDAKSKKDGKMYSFVYYIYPENSYKGEEKGGFLEIIWDIENILIDSLKAF